MYADDGRLKQLEEEIRSLRAKVLELESARGGERDQEQVVGGKAAGTFRSEPDPTDAETERDLLPACRKVVDQLSDAIYLLDYESSRVLYVNGTACRHLGYVREELLGRRLWDFSDSAASLGDWQRIVARIERDGSALFETRHRRRDGGSLDIDINATSLQVGSQRFIVGTARDVTERRRAEAQLLKERAMVERSREEVLSLVSHEMRTPLTAILGFSEYLLENEAAPEVRNEFVRHIVNQGERLKDLIDNLLRLQRLEAGLGLEDPGPVIVSPLLEEVAESFRTPLARQTIEIECGPGIPPVFGEAGHLLHALKNLVGNAVKYSPPDSRIVVGAQADDGKALLWVRDHGPGIPAEEQEKIFDRFYRVRGKKGPGGTGLGLALVREIARAHGGRIWVESTPGEGSTFYLSLPFADRMEDV